MIQQNLMEPNGLWNRLVETEAAFALARRDFFSDTVDRVGLVRQALVVPDGVGRAAALSLLPQMKPAEQMELFPELIHLARAAHGPVETVRKIILALPRDWVLSRIEREIEPILAEEQYDDYWMFLELLSQLDEKRMAKLAERAAQSSNPDIRELADDFLQPSGSDA